MRKIEVPTINLGDKHEMFTAPDFDMIMTEVGGDTLSLWKKEIPEFITALFGAYIDSASNEDVASLVKGLRRKLDILKSRRSRNA